MFGGLGLETRGGIIGKHGIHSKCKLLFYELCRVQLLHELTHKGSLTE